MSRDDERLAAASRILRRQMGTSQQALVGADHSRHIPRLIEDGRADELRVKDLRDHFSKLDATVRVTVWHRGATLDRLVDSRHAGVVNAGVGELLPHDWIVPTEVSFNEWGERGSIDFFGGHERMRAVLVGEAKSEWGSLEETLRTLDVKVRLAPKICESRFGWRPRVVGVVLLFPENATARRIAQRYSATLVSSFPARNRAIRASIRRPVGPLRGLWFLSNVHGSVPTEA